ncbi:MAG: hypothetical protein ACK5HU_02270 [Flavobacteriales bacterium]
MNGYYAYTDSDVSLVDECPVNFMEYFFNLLQKYPDVYKVGFSLKIDDLPECYKDKQKVINWETKFYSVEQEKDVFIAPIDTTFALYRPFSRKGGLKMLRTNFPYQLRHLPWYIDSENLSEEEKYYIESCTQSTHWTKQNK